MLKTLAWKEWREHRPVVVAGVAFAIVLSASGVQGVMLDDVADCGLFGPTARWGWVEIFAGSLVEGR